MLLEYELSEDTEAARHAYLIESQLEKSMLERQGAQWQKSSVSKLHGGTRTSREQPALTVRAKSSPIHSDYRLKLFGSITHQVTAPPTTPLLTTFAGIGNKMAKSTQD